MQEDLSNPSWELNMSRKDTGLFLSSSENAGNHLAVIPAIAKLMDQWIADGYGSHDWTIIGRGAAPGK